MLWGSRSQESTKSVFFHSPACSGPSATLFPTRFETSDLELIYSYTTKQSAS